MARAQARPRHGLPGRGCSQNRKADPRGGLMSWTHPAQLLSSLPASAPDTVPVPSPGSCRQGETQGRAAVTNSSPQTGGLLPAETDPPSLGARTQMSRCCRQAVLAPQLQGRTLPASPSFWWLRAIPDVPRLAAASFPVSASIFPGPLPCVSTSKFPS